MKLRYFAVRHKASGDLMPEVNRKGYSHWNPTTGKVPESSLGTPRLLDTRRKAARCIIMWYTTPNARMAYSQNHDGEEDYDLDIKPDGREMEDLEVVEVELRIVG